MSSYATAFLLVVCLFLILDMASNLDDYLDALRRLQADFENFRKRSLREQDAAADRAGEKIVNRLLPVLDTFELALGHEADPDNSPLAKLHDIHLIASGMPEKAPDGRSYNTSLYYAHALKQAYRKIHMFDVDLADGTKLQESKHCAPGDKAVSAVFDNSKLRRLVPGFAAKVPFAEGIRRTLAWVEADPARQVVDAESNRRWDKLVAAYERGLAAARAEFVP
mgnify:CR=1 FL=1